jgi:hypothetical protein
MLLNSGCLAWFAGSVAPCRARAAYLLDQDGASALQAAARELDPLLAALRRLPLAGRLVPGPQVVRWGALATYRVRLVVAPPPPAARYPATRRSCWMPRPLAWARGRGMARSPLLAGALPGLLLACVLTLVGLLLAALVGLTAHQGPARVYSVATAHAALARAPGHWIGHTLYVRGRLDACPRAPAPCPLWQPRLFEPTVATGRGAVPVALLPSESWLLPLRRLPLLGALLPAPRVVRWGTVGTYAVQIRAQPLSPCLWYRCGGDADFAAFSCAAATCYEALLLDAMP